MSQALVLIDLQNDYFPGGRMVLAGTDAAAAQAARLVAAFRQAGKPVIHIQHISTRAGATFFLPDTEGAQIHAAVAPAAGEDVIVKHFPSAFRNTPLKARLDALGVTEITFAGAMTQLCIDTSVRAAADLGFKCALAHDACATRDLTFGDRTVAAADVQAAFMAALGAFARVATAADLAAGVTAA